MATGGQPGFSNVVANKTQEHLNGLESNFMNRINKCYINFEARLAPKTTIGSQQVHAIKKEMRKTSDTVQQNTRPDNLGIIPLDVSIIPLSPAEHPSPTSMQAVHQGMSPVVSTGVGIISLAPYESLVPSDNDDDAALEQINAELMVLVEYFQQPTTQLPAASETVADLLVSVENESNDTNDLDGVEHHLQAVHQETIFIVPTNVGTIPLALPIPLVQSDNDGDNAVLKEINAKLVAIVEYFQLAATQLPAASETVAGSSVPVENENNDSNDHDGVAHHQLDDVKRREESKEYEEGEILDLGEDERIREGSRRAK